MVLQHSRLISPFFRHCCLVPLLVAVCHLSLQYCCCISFCTAAHAVTLPPALHHHLARGVLSLPVYHRSFASIAHVPDYDDAYKQQARRRILDPASNTLSAAPAPLSAAPPPDEGSVPELRSDVLTLGEPFGQYFAKLQIGTPAKDIAVIIDTGSEFLWIQCNPCEHCGPQASAFPIFDPAKSSSYANVMCDADICQGDDSIAMVCTDSGACQYKVTYGDNSNSSGFLAEETLTFTIAGVAATSNSSSFKLTQFVLGCGINNVGVEAQVNASGLMGLDRGIYSIVSQLGVDIFSYCLPNRGSNAVDVSGYLTFGRDAANSMSSPSPSPSLNPSLQYTPMIQNNHSSFLSQFYYLGLTGISVNDTLLDIPAAALALDTQTGLGGTIIDSGTTLTTFVDEVYMVIAQAFESYVDASYKKLELANNSTRLCYAVPLSGGRGGAPGAPKVTLHFTGSAEMELGTDHLFHLSASDVTNNYYCLAFESGGAVAAGARNVIGNYQQQDFLVQYDLGNGRVGFAAAHCSTTSNHGPYLLALTKPIIWYLTLTVVYYHLI